MGHVAELETRLKFSSAQLDDARREKAELQHCCRQLEDAQHNRYFVHMLCINSTVVDKVLVSTRDNPDTECHLDEAS